MVKQVIPPDVSVEVVENLVDAAIAGMTMRINSTTSTNEVFSATLTMAARTLNAALSMGANPEPLREAVMKLWEMLPKERAS